MLTSMFNVSHRINIVPMKTWYYQYDDPAKLDSIVLPYASTKPLASTFVHRINYNHTIANKAIYGAGKFIYMIRDPSEVMNYLVKERRYREEVALRYYTYRLRRICETARNTDGLFFTWDDLLNNKARPMLMDMLKLKELSFPYKEQSKVEKVVHESIMDKAWSSYNRHLRYLRQLPLKQ